jgi:hypothetical protein
MAGLLAREYAFSRLRVNCYNPDKARTSLQVRAYHAADDYDHLPNPEDHVDAFLYPMSDASKTNGEIFSAA